MVHALEESWRVLRSDGRLIDLRPITAHYPLGINTAQGWVTAGEVDQDEDRQHARAANRAVREVLRGRLFKKTKQKYFDIHFYWDDLEGLARDLEGPFRGGFNYPAPARDRAAQLYANVSGERGIRISIRSKIACYLKQEA